MPKQEPQAAFDHIRKMFHEKIPFNRVLGITVDALGFDRVALRLEMRPELVGNFAVGSLHGGVISAVLDTAGGLTALVGMIKTSRHLTDTTELEIFRKLGTIDLRVDYLRPGVGEHFIASSHAIRTGKRVTVARMELHSDAGKLIAVGTGTYIVS